MSDNLPPGCSVSSIPGNRPEDADWENACQMATAIMQSATPRLLRWEGRNEQGTYVVRPGILNDEQADGLMEAIASALLTAYENGKEAGASEGRLPDCGEENQQY